MRIPRRSERASLPSRVRPRFSHPAIGSLEIYRPRILAGFWERWIDGTRENAKNSRGRTQRRGDGGKRDPGYLEASVYVVDI
jgi:hypothetical protein